MDYRLQEGQRPDPMALIAFGLKALAVVLGAAAIVLTVLQVTSLTTYVLLLSIGLVALAIGAIVDTITLSRSLRELPGLLEVTLRRQLPQRSPRGGGRGRR